MSNFDYTEVNGIFYPNLVLPGADYKIGVWGCGCPVDTSAEEQKHRPNRQVRQRYRAYIKTHRRAFYTSLKMQCQLDKHLHEVDTRASEMYDNVVKQLAQKEGITEALKAADMMAWVTAMNSIANRAREIVWNDITGGGE